MNTQVKNIEAVLIESGNDAAIAEYHRLKEMNHHLLTHLMASKAQADAAARGVLALAGVNKSQTPPRIN